MQSHNVYTHIAAVQEANRRYEQGIVPKMIMKEDFERVRFGEIIDEIFKLTNKQQSLDLIKSYSGLWMQMQSGSQGISGKKLINAMTMFDQLFEVHDNEQEDEVIEDSDDEISKVLED